jgi:hypothetical protein
MVTVTADSPDLIVKASVAQAQIEAETRAGGPSPAGAPDATGSTSAAQPTASGARGSAALPTRFHGTVKLNTARVGADAGKISEEVIAHLAGLVGSEVTVTLEIHAQVPAGAPDNVVRVVTENCRTLKFSDQGFEKE